jgi:transcriptional regulator with XRE-family HTH domain
MAGQSRDRPPKSELHAQLGAELRMLRRARGLSQRKLAPLVGLESWGHVSNIEHGYVGTSEQVVIRWAEECDAQPGQLLIMLEQIHAAERSSEEKRLSGRPSATYELRAEHFYDPPDPARLYAIDTSDMYFTHDERGVGTEVRITLSIRARKPGLNRYYTGWGYNGSTTRGIVTPDAGMGCRVGHFDESDTGVINGYFLLDKVLDPEDAPYSFSFRMLFHSDQRAIPPTIGQFKADASRHAVHIKFTPPALPVKVWWFDVPTAVEVERDPAEHQSIPVQSRRLLLQGVLEAAGRPLLWHPLQMGVK